MADFDDFEKLDIRVGEVIKIEPFPKARKPSYKMWVDFGEEIGIKKTSAQVTKVYTEEQLLGKQVMGVVNFPPRQIADFFSEFLVLGTYSEQGVVLVMPTETVKKGDKLG